MSKYIDAERLKQILKPIEWGTPDERWIPEHEIGAMLDCFPAADVVEARHGRWLMTDAYPHRIYCSNCYGTYALDHWGIWIDGSLPRAYCPNCGAKMDEVEE